VTWTHDPTGSPKAPTSHQVRGSSSKAFEGAKAAWPPNGGAEGLAVTDRTPSNAATDCA